MRRTKSILPLRFGVSTQKGGRERQGGETLTRLVNFGLLDRLGTGGFVELLIKFNGLNNYFRIKPNNSNN